MSVITLTEKDTKDYHERFYVYIYLDPRKPGRYSYDGLNMSFLYEPFYVGKGCGNRYKQHISEAKRTFNKKDNNLKLNKIRKILKTSYPIILKLYKNINEDFSLLLEEKIINSMGLLYKKTGPLTNLLDKGGKGHTGYKHSQHAKEKISISKSSLNNKGENNPLFGIPLSIEHKNKVSKGLLAYYKHNSISKETIKKRNESLKNKTKEQKLESSKKLSNSLKKYYSEHMVSFETRRKISIKKKGQVHTEETKKKLSISHTGKKLSNEHINKLSISNKGKENPRAKIWEIENEQKYTFLVDDLSNFCKVNNLIYTSLKATIKYKNKYSRGFRITSSISKGDFKILLCFLILLYNRRDANSLTCDLSHLDNVI